MTMADLISKVQMREVRKSLERDCVWRVVPDARSALLMQELLQVVSTRSNPRADAAQTIFFAVFGINDELLEPTIVNWPLDRVE
jgi:hypothetical protein